jgi:alpha-1,2-mannosyltransferase
VSTATGIPAEAGEHAAWPGRLAARARALPPRAAVVLGVLAWVAALAAVEPLVRGYLTSAPDQRLVDLDVYRTGGLSVLRGQPLYTVLTQPPQLLAFTYPPVAALFAVPLALIGWPAAQLVWVPFIYVPLAVVLAYAFAPLLGRTGQLRAVVLAALFAGCAYLFPMRDEIRFGQVDMVLLALALADCAAGAPRWPRGALVGLATAIKLVPGIFIVYLWLSGRRRAALTALAVAAAWTLGAWLLLPQDSKTYWTSAIFSPGRLGSNSGTSDQSLRGMLLRAFLPGQAPGAVWVAVAAVVAVAGFAVVRRLAMQGREMEGIAVTGLLGVLLSPVSWIHYFVVVVLVLGAILADGRSPRRAVIAAVTAAYFALTIPWWGQSLLGVHGVPTLAARIVQDGFGIAALVLIAIIATLRRWHDVHYALRLPGTRGHLLSGGAARRRPRCRATAVPDHPGHARRGTRRRGGAGRGPHREFGRGSRHRHPG